MSNIGNDLLKEQEYEQAQEEAHLHFVSQEFSHAVLSQGPMFMLGKLDPEAREEIIEVVKNFINSKE